MDLHMLYIIYTYINCIICIYRKRESEERERERRREREREREGERGRASTLICCSSAARCVSLACHYYTTLK